MAKNITQLEVFVSAPSSMNPQRQLATLAIRELSPALLERLGITLRVTNWQDDVVPGVGQDAQSVINDQIEDRFDVYVGLLGTHFGTPTSRAGSGTEEEFDSAYKRFTANPASLRILFYFKTGVEDAFEIDLEQLSRVKKFKKKLGGAGVLYHDFRDDDALAKAIKQHMEVLLERQWTGRDWLVGSGLQPETKTGTELPIFDGQLRTDRLSSTPDDDWEDIQEEPEILDILVSGMEASDKLQSLLQGMTKKQTEFTTSLQALNETGFTGDATAQRLKWAVDELAGILRVYSRNLVTDLPSFKALTDQVIISFTAISDFSRTAGDQSGNIGGFPEGLISLSDGIRAARLGLMTLRSHISSVPKYTGKLKRAQRAAAEVFDQYAAYMTIALGKLEALQIESASRQQSRIPPKDPGLTES